MPTNERGSVLLESCIVIPILLCLLLGVINIHEHLEKKLQEIIQDRNTKLIQLKTHTSTELSIGQYLPTFRRTSPIGFP